MVNKKSAPKILETSPENTYGGVSFLLKLLAENFLNSQENSCVAVSFLKKIQTEKYLKIHKKTSDF